MKPKDNKNTSKRLKAAPSDLKLLIINHKVLDRQLMEINALISFLLNLKVGSRKNN